MPWKPGSNFDAFHSLEAEKKARIINASLKEFAIKGFKAASTNAIARNAQIGKGMLFYYFGSKEELFEFLCQYTIAFVRDKYVGNINSISGDFIERYKNLSDIKRSIMSEYPEAFEFMESLYRDENTAHFNEFVSETSEIKQKIHEQMFDGIDYSLFREDMDGDTVVKYIRWLFKEYELEVTQRFKSNDFFMDNPQEIANEWERFYAFMDDLRKVYYKGWCKNENH